MSFLLNKLNDERLEKTKAMGEIVNKDDFGAEDQNSCDALDIEITALDKRIAALKVTIANEARDAEFVDELHQNQGGSKDELADNLIEHQRVFENVLRHGVDNITPADKAFVEKLKVNNAMNPDANGSLLIPTTYESKLIKKIESLGGIRATSTVFTTSTGAPISFNTIDDAESEGELLGVGAPAQDGAEPAVEELTLGAYLFSSKIITIDNTLLQDNGYDLENEILSMLAARIWKLENRLYTTGDGVSKPKGLLIAASNGVTAATPTALVMNDLIDLEHSLDATIRMQIGVGFTLNDKTLKIIKKLKNPDGSYVWKGATSEGSPATIFNYPYHINQSMPDVAAGNSPIAFGKLDNFYIRDVEGSSLHRFVEAAYTKKNQTAFLGFKRGDGHLRDFEGQSVKKLTMAA